MKKFEYYLIYFENPAHNWRCCATIRFAIHAHAYSASLFDSFAILDTCEWPKFRTINRIASKNKTNQLQQLGRSASKSCRYSNRNCVHWRFVLFVRVLRERTCPRWSGCVLSRHVVCVSPIVSLRRIRRRLDYSMKMYGTTVWTPPPWSVRVVRWLHGTLR